MTTNFPKNIARVAFVAALLSPVLPIAAQSPASGSATRNIPTVSDRADLVAQQVINKAETHFKQGLLNLKDKQQDQARDEFDKAVDVILESGLDVRAYPTLQRYYLELVERIYRLEAPTAGPMPGQPQYVVANIPANNLGLDGTERLEMRDQDYEPSNLDEISQLELTEQEQVITKEEVQELQQTAATVNFGFEVNPLIQQYINYYQGRGRQTMLDGLQKSGQFVNMARRIFREEGVPEDIVWLGQVESAWKVRARSWASAVGLWQFIPGTGSRFGLRQTAWMDERSSYEKATRASARYLKFLANRYNGNWELAMAAYNTGEGNIDRAISRTGVASF